MKKTYPEIRKKLENLILHNSDQIILLPSLQTLAGEFGCTAPTVMRAVQSLVNNGYLKPLRGGGYISVPRGNTEWRIRFAALVTSSGMQVGLGSYYCLMRHHAVYSLTCLGGPDRTEISDVHLETYDELNKKIGNHIYSGVILVSPKEQVLSRTVKICRTASKPLGVFGSMQPTGQVSAYFDVKNNFPMLMRELANEGRRRILAATRPLNQWNPYMKEVLAQAADSFEYTEFYDDTPEQVTAYVLNNIGGKGKNFDAVIFVMSFAGLYCKLKAQAPKCLCVMPNFAVTTLQTDYHGWIMDFDVESAGKVFGKAMYDALWEPDSEPFHSAIPFKIRKIR